MYVTLKFSNQFWGLSGNVAEIFFDRQLQNVQIQLFWKLKQNSSVGRALIISKSRVLVFAGFRAVTDQKMAGSGSQIMKNEEILYVYWLPGQTNVFYLSKKLEIEEKPEKWAKLPVIPDIGPRGTLEGWMRPKTIWVI